MAGRGAAQMAEAVETVSPGLALPALDDVSHNLNGQRLGRKGRVTRDRILCACAELLADPGETPISLSAVARRANLGMTSLYNYFADLTELLLAVLEPVMATAEESYLAVLRERWPDEALGERCYEFVRAYHAFWTRHSRLLHLRNALADQRDERMLQHRVASAGPLIATVTAQLDGDMSAPGSMARGMATVLVTGIERTVTVSTDPLYFARIGQPNGRQPDDFYLEPQARVLELAIRDTRARVARERAG